MMNVICYFNRNDPDLQSIRDMLQELEEQYPHRLTEVSVDDDPDIYQVYHGRTPALEVGPYHLFSPFSRQDLVMMLGAAHDRQALLVETEDIHFQQRIEKGARVSGSDRFTLWFTRYYMTFVNVWMFIFVALPFLAPVLMENGWTGLARGIYSIYSPVCHQLGYRSWFLFGQQNAYPRALAGLPGISFEAATGIDPTDFTAAKNFIGNPQMGYKVAICERDAAIYGGIFLFGALFALTGRRIKPLKWYYWLILGIIPIAVDGFSQMPALFALNLSWLPIRESTPFLRTLTGLLFGVTTAWYGLPLIEENMRDSRKLLLKKIAVNEMNTHAG